jgi:hypothetical protein
VTYLLVVLLIPFRVLCLDHEPVILALAGVRAAVAAIH